MIEILSTFEVSKCEKCNLSYRVKGKNGYRPVVLWIANFHNIFIWLQPPEFIIFPLLFLSKLILGWDLSNIRPN